MEQDFKKDRREFFKSSASLAVAATFGSLVDVLKYKPRLSFSTLGCPGWSFKKVIQSAVENEYQGIELRGILDQMDLTKCLEFNSPQNIRDNLLMVKENGLRIVNLGSSAQMHILEPTLRKQNLDEAKRFIDLAASLSCSYVRVFPENLPKNQDRFETIDLISNGLQELGNYANGSNVSVLLESHGDVVGKDILYQIMHQTNHARVGLIWDILNMWSVTKELPTEVHEKLGNYIRHVHIKDAVWVDGKQHYVKIGRGVTPLGEAINSLVKQGYKEYYSFEWEKRWHPELEEPETAIPDYPKAMQKYFSQG